MTSSSEPGPRDKLTDDTGVRSLATKYHGKPIDEAFRDNVVARKEKKIVAVSSSSLGSISRAADLPRRPYFYRMSKAAMNMALQALGADLKTQGVAVALVAPGVVDTEMHVSFMARPNAGSTGHSTTTAP